MELSWNSFQRQYKCIHGPTNKQEISLAYKQQKHKSKPKMSPRMLPRMLPRMSPKSKPIMEEPRMSPKSKPMMEEQRMSPKKIIKKSPKANDMKVVIYSKPTCPYCIKAKALLDSKGIKYKEINVTKSPAIKSEMIRKSMGATTVPQIFFDNQHIGGYENLVRYFSK